MEKTANALANDGLIFKADSLYKNTYCKLTQKSTKKVHYCYQQNTIARLPVSTSSENLGG